jgi:myo-inositol-1-phosphate synthase
MARRVGLWLVGAFGGVGTTITLGLSAMARGLVDQTGLVTDLPDFRELPLPAPGDFVVGGHEIRRTSFEESAEEFRRNTGVFDASWLSACRDDLAAATSRVRPGPKLGLGPAIARLADWDAGDEPATARQAIDRVKSDIAAFVKSEKVDHLIVLNVASTEAPFGIGEPHQTLKSLNAALSRTDALILPSSSHYALAALEEGHTYLNFTPSLGASFPAAWELAETTGSLFGGKDGKTGETLMKTVLAPMFAARNFKVMSWVGHNIFGNRDGVVLDDPQNKSSKVETKDKVITEILGYKPASVVSIEYVPDMGDWKTAWDHIHFKGFLGTKMVLQFIWQGCDSLLAAPLGVDLARLADLERQRGGRGLMRHLSCFFKGPEGVDENDFFKQFTRLEEYVASLRAKAK